MKENLENKEEEIKEEPVTKVTETMDTVKEEVVEVVKEETPVKEENKESK